MEKNDETHVDPWIDERLATLDPDSAWQPNAGEGLARLRTRRGAVGARHRRWTWAAAMVTTASLGAVAFPGTFVLAQRCVGACGEAGMRLWQSFTNKGAIPASSRLEADHKIAPDFTLNDASGNAVRLSDFKGKVVLLNFWATWCAPCRVEIPWFSEFQQTYGSRDFVALGVSLDDDGWKSVRPFVEENKVGYRVMIGNGNISALYGGIESLPTTVIVDKAGRIASIHVGLTSKNDYRSEIERLLNR